MGCRNHWQLQTKNDQEESLYSQMVDCLLTIVCPYLSQGIKSRLHHRGIVMAFELSGTVILGRYNCISFTSRSNWFPGLRLAVIKLMNFHKVI